MPSRGIVSGNNSAVWRVALALLFSVLLHVVLLGFLHVDISIFEPKKDVVEVRFAEPVKSPPSEPVKPKAKPGIEEPLPAPEPSPVTVPAEESLPLDLSPEILPQEQTVAEATASETISDDAEEAGSGPESERVVSVIDEEKPPLSFVETEFDILRGIDGNKIGQTRIHYQSKDNGTYLIESESEARGFASLFISGKLRQRSEGLLTEQGLQPQSFLYQYGKDIKAQRATFDRDNHRMTLETGKGTQTVPLPADAQDLISFMYQFMFVPPLQEMQLNITNGKRLKTYGYSFVGEEDLSTKIGIVRAMHLENINDDGDEKNELWLAVDYRFLPVKIRKTEKDGSVIEQVVTNIKTDILQ